MRTLLLIISIAGAYVLLHGWSSGPGLILRASLAGAVIVAGLILWGTGRKASTRCRRMASLKKATLLDYCSLGMIILFIAACFVVFTSTLAQPAQKFAYLIHDSITGIDNNERMSGDHTRDIGDGSTLGQDHAGPWIFKKNLERDLPQQSNIKPTNKPEAFLEITNHHDATSLLDSRIYLSTFAFSQFNGTSWSALPSPRTIQEAPVRFPKIISELPSIPHRIYHAANPTGQNVFTSLQGAVTTDVQTLTKLAESIYLLPDNLDTGNGYDYYATSQPVLLTQLLEKKIIPARADKGELVLPQDMLKRLRKTASHFKKEPDTISQLRALRSYLHKNYTYSLKTTNKSGSSPLENFLYTEKRGYCEHFATAAALLCRALGIPSRIAYGWSGGLFYPAQNMFVFRAKDAHAWTEIKIKGYGWVVFDTTPPDANATSETETAPDNEQAPDPNKALNTDIEKSNQDHDNATAGARVDHKKSLAVLGALCLCLLIFFTLRYINRGQTTPDGRPITHSQPSYLVHFKQTTAALGYPMPLGRTLRQHILKLKTTEIAPKFLDDLLAYHYQMTYADTNKNPALEKQLNQNIRQWKNTYTKKLSSNFLVE